MIFYKGCLLLIVGVTAGIIYGIYLIVTDIFIPASNVHPVKNNTNETYFNWTASTWEENATFILQMSALRSMKNRSALNSLQLDNRMLNISLAVTAHPMPMKDVPPQCVDPTFACQDLENARLCGVVKSCIHDIWSTMSAPDDNDEICDICKEMVKEARDQLLSNMTQEELKEVFEGSCKLIPVQIVADGCIKIVDELIPELVEMLASRMDPTMVCTVSGLCYASHLPAENQLLKIFRMILKFRKDDQCTDCVKMMSDVQVFLKSTTEADVKTYIETFCDEKAPSYMCDLLVNTYFPEIYKYVISTDARTMCGSVGICPKNCEEHSKVRDELTCEFCEHVLEHIKELITANTTAEEFKTALLNFCKHMGNFSDKCSSLVNDYYDMLFDYIRKLDTKGMCTLIGLCSNDQCSKLPLVKLIPTEEARQRIPLIRLEPAKRIPLIRLEPAKQIPDNIGVHPLVRLIPASILRKKEMIESNDIFPTAQLPLERLIHPSAVFQEDAECAFCKAISFYLKQDLNGDRSKESVQKTIDEVCDKWVKDFPHHCQQFLNKYSVKTEDVIVKGIEFGDICSSVKACPLEKNEKDLNVKVVSNIEDNPFCDLCKDAMNEVEKQLSDPATKEKVKSILDTVCNIVPQPMKDDCVSFVNSNIDALFDIIQQEMQPDNICPALGLCPASSKIVVPQRVKDLECDVCKDVVTSLRQNLEQPGSKKVILTFLEEACARLPGSLAEECKKFMDENIDTIMGILIEEIDPATVCSVLKFCPGSVRKEKPRKFKNLECFLCIEVVQKVEELIKDKRTEEEIIAALDKVCSCLPKSIAGKCEEFVNKYTELLISLLAEGMDPEMVCSVLHLCPGSVRKEKPRKLKDLECDLCKDVVLKVEELIKEKKTEDEIRAALDKVCSYLPKSVAAKCEEFVNKYTELLISLLAQEMDPEMVCAALNVCPAKVGYAEWESKAQDLECQGCQYALHFVQEQLMNPNTQGELKNVLKKICGFLPDTLEKNCEAFVDEYGSSLLALIAQEIDPSTMCYKLKLCTNQTYVVKKIPVVQLRPFSDDECTICTTVVDYIDKLLEEDDVDKEITKLVEKVCKVLPSSYQAKCTSILETYGPYILQAIGQMTNSRQVCQNIDFCPTPAGHVHLVGGNKCTFGPSYWCRSKVHAAACKAEEFCEQKVWNN